ncbi:MAG: CvpA family protein, partial [Janthinobacterium lividum]
DEAILSILSIIIAYVASLIISAFINSRLTSILRDVGGNSTDKFLGLLAGFIKGNVICLIIFMTIVVFSTSQYHNLRTTGKIVISDNEDKYPLWFSKSVSFKYMSSIATSLISNLPEDILSPYKLSKEVEQGSITIMEDELFLPNYENSFDEPASE